jgi:hypothetical protein
MYLNEHSIVDLAEKAVVSPIVAHPFPDAPPGPRLP